MFVFYSNLFRQTGVNQTIYSEHKVSSFRPENTTITQHEGHTQSMHSYSYITAEHSQLSLPRQDDCKAMMDINCKPRIHNKYTKYEGQPHLGKQKTLEKFERRLFEILVISN